MRFTDLYVRTAVLASLILAAGACQTAHKPVSLLPPGTAPSLQPLQPAAPVAATAQAAGPHATPQADEAPQKPEPSSQESSASASAPASDPVGDLIARAEKEYQAGLSNHQAGKIDEAKQNFDNALNDLLSSN